MNSKEFNTKFLNDVGASFESKNNGEHLIVHSVKGVLDFWPSTGKWKFRTGDRFGQGIDTLAEHLLSSEVPVPDLKDLLLEAYALRKNWPSEFTQRVMLALGKSPEAHESKSTLPWD